MARRLKGQMSLVRLAEEGVRMLRAADDLAEVKAISRRYRKSGYDYYGVTIGKSDSGRGRLCLSARLPKDEAEMVAVAINDAIRNCRLTLAHKAHEVIRGSVAVITGEAKPAKIESEKPDTNGQENESETHPAP